MRYLAALAPAAALAAVLGCGLDRPARKPELPALTVVQKIEISRDALPAVERRFGGPLGDLAVQAYVRAVGERLVRHTPTHDLPYKFVVLDTEEPVALAMPGGNVFVSRGILRRLSTESELAALLAHLAAHLGACHLEQRSDPLILSKAAVMMARTDATDAALSSVWDLKSLISRRWMDLKYTPEMEAEADRLAMDYLAAAGYNPDSAVRLAAVLGAVTGRGAEEFLAKHPHPAGCVDDLQRALSRKYPDLGGREARGEYRREVLDRLQQ